MAGDLVNLTFLARINFYGVLTVLCPSFIVYSAYDFLKARLCLATQIAVTSACVDPYQALVK